MKKKRLIILSSILVLVIVLAITSSYALFNMNITKNKIFKVAVGDLELRITDTETEDKIIVNNMIPIKEETALEQDAYTFTLTNTGTLPAAYTIYLDDITVSDLPAGITGRLDDSLVRANLYNKKTGKKYTFSLENNRILEAGVLDSTDSIEYELRIWLDYNAGNEAQNKYYAGKIRVEGVQSNGIKSLGSVILEQNKVVQAEPDLTTTSELANENGLYKKSVTGGFGGADGDTYYFRGNVTNNYVSFAGYIWRIVRINEDGTIRLIMQEGINNNANYAFQSNRNDYNYMYYSFKSSDDSVTAKTILDNWYQENIFSKGYSEKVADGNYFCEQDKVKLDDAYTSNLANTLVYGNYNPSFNCSTDGNGYGLVNSNIGLLDYDEVVFAGGYPKTTNRNYYLYSNSYYWILSPSGINGTFAVKWNVNNAGQLQNSSSNNTDRGLRPVINLKADVQVTGNGKQADPYVVIMDDNYKTSSSVDLAISQFDQNDLKDVIMCDQSGDKYTNCKIYNTIDDAIEDRDSGTIILTKDITRTNNITIPNNKNIILDMNGKNITLNIFSTNGNLEVINSKNTGKIITNNNAFNMVGNGTQLVLRNVEIESNTIGVWVSSSCRNCNVDIHDIKINAATKGMGINGNALNSCINVYGNTNVVSEHSAIEIMGDTNELNINGGVFVSNTTVTVRASTDSLINITQTSTPIYISSMSQTWNPAIVNASTGTINIKANRANACTSNANDTTSGLCVYAEGNGDYTTNSGNGAVQNSSTGTININGGTYYGMNLGIQNASTGKITIQNAKIDSDGFAVYENGAGRIDIASSNLYAKNYYAVIENKAGIINITSGTFTSESHSAIRNTTTGAININQTTNPIYITSLAQVYAPAIKNNSSGTINITANQANACTSNVGDTTSGLCVYAEGDKNYEANTANGAIQNVDGLFNIDGGTYYGGQKAIDGGGDGTINIKNANLISPRYAVANNKAGFVNVCSSIVNGGYKDLANSSSSTGTINYSSDVVFSNGTTTPDSSKLANPAGTINSGYTCPATWPTE